MTPRPCNPDSSVREQAFEGDCLSIADLTVGILSADPAMTVRLDAGMSRFRKAGVQPDLVLRAAWGDLAERGAGRMLFDSGGVWQLSVKDGLYHFACFAPALGTVPYKVASLDREFRKGEVRLHRPYFDAGAPVDPLQYPLDELLLVHMLSRGKGVEIHACGLVDGSGAGCAFVGHSGDGKSTMARLWECEPDAVVLSDDRIVLRRVDGRIWMYGTPWHGEADLARAARAPLRHLFFLRKAGRNLLRPVSGAATVARLFCCSFPAFYDKAGLAYTLEFLEEIAGTIPCSELSVVPDHRVVKLIRQHLA